MIFHELQEPGRTQAANLGRTNRGSKGRIQNVNVQAEPAWNIANLITYSLGNLSWMLSIKLPSCPDMATGVSQILV